MHLPSAKFSQSIRKFIHARFGTNPGFASEEEAALAVSTLLQVQASMTPEAQQAKYRQLSELLRDIGSSLQLREKAPQLSGEIEAIDSKISAIDRDRSVAIVEAQEAAVLDQLETFVDQLFANTALNSEAREAAALKIAQWDYSRISDHFSEPDNSDANPDHAITKDSLTAYLRARFEDPNLQLTAFSAGAGGIGKETMFFATSGKLSGDFVLRRDRAQPLIDNDCHRVAIEYPVVRAVRDAGFCAPEALWLEVEHAMLPGSDFFVMRRAPGTVQGTVFGGAGILPNETVVTLANAVGRLHRLDPLIGLGDLNESIRTELWSLPLTEVVRRYITGYYEYFLANRISSAPAMAAVFKWLLNNIPVCEDRPVLLHGDLGLHNLLFVDNALSVVLDWEQAHIGDPMEDIAFIRNTANASLDWPAFVATYEAASGNKVDPQRLHFQQVWGEAKNAAGSILAADCYASGKMDAFNLAHLGLVYYPTFLDKAMRLIG